MRWLVFMMLVGCSAAKVPSRVAEFSCQRPDICVMGQENQIVAINSSSEAVAIELRINHIENVELSYRYPFVEFLAPHSSVVLLNYQIKRPQADYAFDYDWNWRSLR